MSILTRTTALIGAGTILAVPTAVLVSAPAHADVDRHGRCGGGVYEFSVDREGRGIEIDAGLERVAPGSKWRLTLTHDGTRYYSGVRRADHEGDVDVDRHRPNTAGTDTFKFRAKRVGHKVGCTATITLR